MFSRTQILGLAVFVATLLVAYRLADIEFTIRQRQVAPINFARDFDPNSYGDVIGIEFGDTYSRVGYYDNTTYHVVVDDKGYNSTPSYVAYTHGGILIGHPAVKQAANNPKNTFYNFRDLLGRKLPDRRVQKVIDRLPYDVVNIKGQPRIKAIVPGWSGRWYQLLSPEVQYLSPEEITSKLIAKLKIDAERQVNHTVSHAVVTLPSYFNDVQRQATMDACALAGIKVLRIVNEPTAAGIAHSIQKEKGDLVHIVYDIRQDGVDVTLLSTDQEVYEIYGSVHDSNLSANDFDQMVLESVIQQLIDKNTIQSKEDIVNMENLKGKVKKVQEALLLNEASSSEQLVKLKAKGTTKTTTITRPQILAVRETFLRKTLDLITKVLKEAKVPRREVAHVVPVGPLSILQQAQPILEEYFSGQDKMLFSTDFYPDEAIVRGAAAQGYILANEELDMCTLSYDVSALSLGIEITGGVFGKVIPRNTVIPTRKSVNVTTATDGQETIVLNIYEGERFHVLFNKLLMTREIDVPKKPMGEAIVTLAFEIDANRLLTVRAEELSSGEVTKLVVPQEPILSWTDIDEIVIAADRHFEYEKDLAEVHASLLRTDPRRLASGRSGAVFVWSLKDRE